MDEYTVLVGSAGVFVLLLAFFLNLFGRLRADSKTYVGMNLAGALLAGYASLMIDFMPFVVLEGTWALVALAGLVHIVRKERG